MLSLQRSVYAGCATGNLCVRVTQQIASVMSKSVVYPITKIMSGAMKMNAVGIDVSKGKSTVAILSPQGIVVASPYDVPHTGSSLKELAATIKKLRGETRVVMEATGNYYEPIARFLHEQGIFVSVVNPMLISDFGGNTLRRPKTDKKDAVKLALYALTYWLDLKQYKPQEDLRKSLKMLNRQYQFAVKQQTMLNNNLISQLDLTFPGINKLFTSPDREQDGHLKWVDSLWNSHIVIVSQSSHRVLSERNIKAGVKATAITIAVPKQRKFMNLREKQSAQFRHLMQSF